MIYTSLNVAVNCNNAGLEVVREEAVGCRVGALSIIEVCGRSAVALGGHRHLNHIELLRRDSEVRAVLVIWVARVHTDVLLGSDKPQVEPVGGRPRLGPGPLW